MPNECRLSQRARWAVGQPIHYLMREALARPELISLAAGFVDQQTLPVEITQAAVEHVLADPRRGPAALQYTSTMGDAVLRELLLQRLQAADGAALSDPELSIDRMVLTAGSNELLYLLGEILLDESDIVLCPAPSYFVYLGGLANLGARSYGVAVDQHGLIPEALEETLQNLQRSGELPRVKAIYVCTYHDNPSSLTLAADRRSQIVETAKRYSRHGTIFVIEDAVYRELRYFGPDIASLLAADPDGSTVIHTNSFSKSYSPGLRVGWGILPTVLVEPFCNQKGNIDFGSPHFSQQVMAAVLQLGLFDQHLDILRNSYRHKLEAMVGAIEQHFRSMPHVSWLPAEGGLYVWMQVEGVDTGSAGPLFRKALDEGVMYVPGIHCYPLEGEAARHDMIRLSFGVQPAERIREGIASLAQAVEEVSHAPAK
ncbi:MAG: PLP-dependent aminotransferase family protein [Planctomycetota bacterium]|nr:PLP-dependent aminotransferase family protein [Planctomycetota bacterium]